MHSQNCFCLLSNTGIPCWLISITAQIANVTDNILVDNSRLLSSSQPPQINGLSDHDAQFLTISNTYAATHKIPLKQRTNLKY